MKKVLSNSNNTFLSLLLLCFTYTVLSASLPLNTINSTSDPTEEKLSIIDCPEDLVLNVDNFSCAASGELPLPTNIHGLCGGNEFSAETSEGGTLNVTGSLENGDLSVFALNLAPGTHLIQYMVSDSCDNVFDCEFEAVVHPISSSIFLKQDVIVALSTTATNGKPMTTIHPQNIDNGSNNPCIPIKLEIRKDVDLCGIPGNVTYNADGHPNDGDSDPNSANYDPDDGQSIKFCCEDASNTLYDVDGDGNYEVGYMKVWMRLWEDRDMDGLFGTTGDNYYEVWTFVKVEDRSSPTIICPLDVTITCDLDYTDLNLTGSASAFGSCEELAVEYNDITIDSSACNQGSINRSWSIIGSSDILCVQTITIEELDDPVTVTVSFSQIEDFTTENCPDMIALGEPSWIAGPCDVIGYAVDSDTFLFEDAACLKIVNHYTVINWCDYKPTDPNWNGDGIWEHTQVIKILEEIVPNLEECSDVIFAVNDHSDSDNDGEVCEAMIVLTNVAIDTGGENCPTAWLKWEVVVDLWADGTPDLEYSSLLPSSDNVFDDTNGNTIPDIYFAPTKSEEEVIIQLPDIVGALSNHKVKWWVVDGCNNSTSCSSDFLVKDETPPTAACQDTVTVGLSQIGPSRIWAINYISEAIDNCSSNEDLFYTFSPTLPPDDPSYDPVRKSSNYIISFNDIVSNGVQLPIYVWDKNGNFTTCEIVFIIDPNLILDTQEVEETPADTLHQNQPNPFQLSTSISFDLHRATPVKLSFINATSLKILEIEIAGKKGLNTYTLDRDLLSGKGLYFYTMTTKYHKETRKMILMH